MKMLKCPKGIQRSSVNKTVVSIVHVLYRTWQSGETEDSRRTGLMRSAGQLLLHPSLLPNEAVLWSSLTAIVPVT